MLFACKKAYIVIYKLQMVFQVNVNFLSYFLSSKKLGAPRRLLAFIKTFLKINQTINAMTNNEKIDVHGFILNKCH